MKLSANIIYQDIPANGFALFENDLLGCWSVLLDFGQYCGCICMRPGNCVLLYYKYTYTTPALLKFLRGKLNAITPSPQAYPSEPPEAEFLDVTGTKVLRVFLLATHSHPTHL
jgi:hypothetical protein